MGYIHKRSPFGVDQTQPGSFTKTVINYLDSKDKSYVIYQTKDNHAASENPFDYINLKFDDWQYALGVALAYQPTKAPCLAGLNRSYTMNVGIGPSLAGWLFTVAAERGQVSAINLGAVFLGAPAFNFIRDKLSEIVNSALWTREGPKFIAGLMKKPFCMSPNGRPMSYKFAQSSEKFEVDINSPYHTDAAIKIFHGMQDELVHYEQTLTFSKQILSPIEPQLFLTPNGGHDFTEDSEQFNLFLSQLTNLENHPKYGLYYKVGLMWNQWSLESDNNRHTKYKHNACGVTFFVVKDALAHSCDSQ